jgi:sarcosine oxidase, subunit beta
VADKKAYDAIIIGAGSIGNPTAVYLTAEKLRVLVLEKCPTVGQGQNKAAIGGVRATHSDFAKIHTCQMSLDVFSTWKENYGDDIGWYKGGYCFPVYREQEETLLKGMLLMQKPAGLYIDWLDIKGLKEVVPGINTKELRGGTFSPDDGQVSPLMAAAAFHRTASKHGAEFRFNEKVISTEVKNGRITGVTTDKGTYFAPIVINAAGAEAAEVGRTAGLDIPVNPDCHEAGITAPVARMFKPLIVDLRPGPEGKTLNFYFAQNHENQIIFCYTPNPPIIGIDRESTSEFMPVIARRLISLIPKLRNVYVRRVWRGLYPMTPDGIPIVDRVKEIEGLYLAVGMCGQGFMLGPGVAKNLANLILRGKPLIKEEYFASFSFYRDFYRAKKEALK